MISFLLLEQKFVIKRLFVYTLLPPSVREFLNPAMTALPNIRTMVYGFAMPLVTALSLYRKRMLTFPRRGRDIEHEGHKCAAPSMASHNRVTKAVTAAFEP
jgi:hypothetical protein